MKLNKKRSFTLIEMIVVLVIIGVLATLGYTHYAAVIERARGAEAKNMLLLIYRNYKTAEVEGVNFSLGTDPSYTNDTQWENKLFIENPNISTTSFFGYTTVLATPTAIANRRNGNSPYAARTNNVDVSKFLRVNLNTGAITTSGAYN